MTKTAEITEVVTRETIGVHSQARREGQTILLLR